MRLIHQLLKIIDLEKPATVEEVRSIVANVAAVGPRERLPMQRCGVCIPLGCRLGNNKFEFNAHFNFYEDGRLGEMFAHPFKTGADLESLLDKFCIAVSRCLQHGDRIIDFWHSVDDGTPPEARDIFSAIIVGGIEAEKQKMAEMEEAKMAETRI